MSFNFSKKIKMRGPIEGIRKELFDRTVGWSTRQMPKILIAPRSLC